METRSAEIIELLRSKNRCLDRLMAETRAFLSSPLDTLVAETEGAVGPLAAYEEARASIVRTLELHDGRIMELIGGLPAPEKTPAFLAEVRDEMTKNERLIVAVFNADDVVFRKIGDAQAQIQKLIQENRKSRALLGKFKSSPERTGEGMDTTL